MIPETEVEDSREQKHKSSGHPRPPSFVTISFI